MSRLYCEHLVPIDEECEECPPPVDLWECARTWQALRDWLNGTAEQWAIREQEAYDEGENDGYDRALDNMRNARALLPPKASEDLPPWLR